MIIDGRWQRICLSLSRLTSYNLQISRLAAIQDRIILENPSGGKNLVQALNKYIATFRLNRKLLTNLFHEHLALYTICVL